MAILNSPFTISEPGGGANEALAVEIWSQMLFVEALNATFINRFMGDTTDSLFVRLTDLERGPGDTIRFDLLTQEAGYGVNDNAELKGSEGAIGYQPSTVIIEQKRHALSHYRMSQQRTIHDLRRDAMRNLKDFFARVIDEHAAAALVGELQAGALKTDVDDFHGVTLTAPDAAHKKDHGATTFKADHISAAKWNAATITSANNGPIRPIRINGMDWYVMFVHPYQAANLRQDSDWINAQQNAQLRGDANPIFTGALGVYDGVVLHAWNYLPPGATNDKHAVLCGAGALTVAFGRSFTALDGVTRGTTRDDGFPVHWVEEIEDYGGQVGIAAGMVYGIKKNIFNSIDYATYRVTTEDVAP